MLVCAIRYQTPATPAASSSVTKFTHTNDTAPPNTNRKDEPLPKQPPEDPHEQALGTLIALKDVSIAGVWKTPGEPMKSLVVSALKPDAFNTQRSPGSSRSTRSSRSF